MLNSGYFNNKDFSIEKLTVDELFLFDTILSEHNREGISCEIFEELSNRIRNNCKRKILSKNNSQKPDRFSLFEAIDSMIITDNKFGVSITDKLFSKIKNDVEQFLKLRNPYLLDIIKEEGTFKNKLWGLNFLIEYYAFETGEHTEEVGIISKTLADSINRKYSKNIDLENFTDFGHFHDLGKLLIPSEILLKPGKLTPEEFEIIKKHSIYGSILVKLILIYSKDKNNKETRDYADSIINTALYHHKTLEAGYPNELSSENLTLESEIVRISDIFHALISKRIYKTKYDEASVWEIISNMEGTFKYPEVFEVFFEIKEQLINIVKDRENAVKAFEILGNKEIDSDHILIENQLQKVLNSEDSDIMNEYLKLIEIIKIHFKKEEELMIKYNYSDYQKNKKAHDELLVRTSFMSSFNISDISADFIKKFIGIWLKRTYHIHNQTIDKKFVDYLKEQNN